MLKLSCPSIMKPLLNIFRDCENFGTFPDNSKKGKIVPIHKKHNKQLVNNYRLVQKFLKSLYLTLIFNL